jgi:hypothetical protein
VLQTERDLVSIFLDACLFEWQTGHHELATGLLQAQAEYSVFAPRIQASEASKQTLFQQFWASGAPRVGERGALGWGTWLAKEEERLQSWRRGVANEEEETEEERGGWTGWRDLKEMGGRRVESDSGKNEGDSDGGEDEQGSEDGQAEEESDEVLLKRLGINLDAADAVETASADTWRKWALEEEARDEHQWLPLRPNKERGLEGVSGDEDWEADDELQRTVLFEDVQPFLFSLETETAEAELLAGFGGFCEAPMAPWSSSNDAQFTEAQEFITGTLRNQLCCATADERNADVTFLSAAKDVPGAMESNIPVAKGGEVLANMVGGPSWMELDTPERRNFVFHLLLQSSGAFPAFQPLTDALLRVTSSGDVSKKEARSLAKSLLKSRREDLALWGAYAELEASAGNFAAARKVLGTALGSVSALPTSAREKAPELFLKFAEMELRIGEERDGQGGAQAPSDSQGKQAALHILTCFGEGEAFTPAGADTVPPSRILKVSCFAIGFLLQGFILGLKPSRCKYASVEPTWIIWAQNVLNSAVLRYRFLFKV